MWATRSNPACRAGSSAESPVAAVRSRESIAQATAMQDGLLDAIRHIIWTYSPHLSEHLVVGPDLNRRSTLGRGQRDLPQIEGVGMNQVRHRRVVVPRRGGPEVLQVVEEELPEPRAGEVRVKTLAAGVSAYDLMVRSGRFPGFPRVPFTPGVDIVGVVDKLGEGVATVEPGQRVAGGPSLAGGATRSSSAGPPASWCPSPRAWILPRPSAWRPTTSPRTWHCTKPPACTAANASWSTVRRAGSGPRCWSSA